MLGKFTVKLATAGFLMPLLIGVCNAQDNSVSTAAQLPRNANMSLVQNMLERHFYLPEKTQNVKGMNADEVLSYLIDSGLDRWAKYHTKTSTESNVSQSVRNDFGLRLISHNGTFFLIPEIDGPNEKERFVIYRVLEAPKDGDWKSAIANSSLRLAAPNQAVRFVKDEYVTTAFKLRGPVLRVDNFTNAGIEFSIDRYSDRIPNISVLDLRFNGGGRVDLAAQLLEAMFNEPVRLGYSLIKGERSYYGDSGANIERDRFAGLTVLVSRHTASAAEWVARILQHYGAVVVGERTEGKCLIHNVYPVGNRVYFEIATGYLKTEFKTGYNYCNHGLVPNLFAYDIPLINEDAKRIATMANNCIDDNVKDSLTELCRQIFPGVVEQGDDPTTLEAPGAEVPRSEPGTGSTTDAQ